MSEMNKETVTETKPIKPKKSIKKSKIVLIAGVIILLIICAVLMYLRDVKVEENQYFVRCRVNTETNTDVSTIYYYDAEEHEIKEIASINGYMRRGVVNEDESQMLAIVDGNIILCDLIDWSILKKVTFSDLENKLGIQDKEVSYWWPDFDFTDDGEGVYITMCIEGDYQSFLYHIATDKLELVAEDMELDDSEYVGDYIYYIDYEDDSIKRYHADACITETMVSFSEKINSFSVSPNGEKILIDVLNPYPGLTDELYLYDIKEDKLHVAERGYYFSDFVWNGNSYVYVEEHWGILSDINPSIKVDNGRGIMDKEIYQIKGFLKGGTLWLIENPSGGES